MKEVIAKILETTLTRLFDKGVFIPCEVPDYSIEVPREEKHGDFATNLAMTLAKPQKKSPRLIAQSIVDEIRNVDDVLAGVSIAGPGFINFSLSKTSWRERIRQILTQRDSFGESGTGKGQKVLLEFVSANPTGPLHVGHGRGAALGDALANILTAVGYEVEREYYVNDAGNQMDTLGRSVFYRCREIKGEEVDFPEDLYQGDYIGELAHEFLSRPDAEELMSNSEKIIEVLKDFASERILESIMADLEQFGVKFDSWFSEKTLVEKNTLDEVLKILRQKDLIYEKEGATWFRATAFEDEKDRVLVRSNGLVTYFATDVAYHWNKVERGFSALIDIWGADHHGYIPRIRASLEGLGGYSSRLEVLMVQLVNLMRAGKQVAMSTRRAQYVTLSDVIEEVGSDVARYIFLTRKSDAPLDFDLDLAKKQSNENPVYYVQYAHARIASVLRVAREKGFELPEIKQADFGFLGNNDEMKLIKRLSAFTEEVQVCAQNFEPHRLTYYLADLVTLFHRFYHDHRIISEDEGLSRARLLLVQAIKTVIKNGLTLLGVSAPESM